MKRIVAIMLALGLMSFAGTCVLTNFTLTNTDGTHDTFGAQFINNTGANFLGHDFVVAFVDANGNVVDTQTVQGCLRSWQNGASDFFSATSIQSASVTAAALARLGFDPALTAGTTVPGNAVITNVSVTLNGTTLTITGKITNNDSAILSAPAVCAVVYNSTGQVVITSKTTAGDLSTGVASNFTVTITVPNNTTTVNHVDLWADGLKAGTPITPISATGNAVVTATPTPAATPGPAAQLAFTTNPAASSASPAYGVAFTTQPVVAVQDINGNTQTSSTASVTLGILGGTGTLGATLTCTNTGTNGTTAAAVNGIATFTGCTIDKAGFLYRLTATSSPLSPGISNGFNVNAGAPASIAFTPGPGGTITGGTAFPTQPLVSILDSNGQVVWSDSTAVTLTLSGGTSGATLTCTNAANTMNFVFGIAAFSGCKIDKAGSGYQLVATRTGLPIATSSAFTVIVGSAAKLAFTTQPSATATAATAFATQPVVTIQDAGGNTVTASTAAVTLALNVTSGTGTLSCTTNPVLAALGVASFGGCKISAAGTYTLTASSPSLTSATSSSITVS